MFAAKPMPVTDPVWTEDPVLQVVEHVHFPWEDYLVSYVFYIIYICIYIRKKPLHQKGLINVLIGCVGWNTIHQGIGEWQRFLDLNVSLHVAVFGEGFK